MAYHKQVESREYAIGGCPREIAVVGSVLRVALESLQLPHEVCNVTLKDTSELTKLVLSVQKQKLHGLCLSGALCHQVPCLVDNMDASATASGCADALTAGQAGIVATNLTYLAFVDLLKKTETPRSTVAIVGSGARACAAIAACQSLGFQVICVTSRSWISTEALHESESAQRLRRLGALPTLWPNVTDPVQSSNFSREMRMQFREIAASANVFIQTVAVDSLSTDARQISQTIPWSQTRRDALVCDLVYGPSPGPFLASAEKEALARVGGIEMLTKYSARLVEFFTGQQLSRSLLHAAALRVCTRPFP